MFLAGSIAFLAGVALGAFLPYLPVVLLCLLAFGAVVLTVVETRSGLDKKQAFTIYGCLLAGILVWTAGASDDHASRLVEQAGQHRTDVVATIVEPVRHSSSRSVMIAAVERLGRGAAASPAEGHVRLTWRGPDESFSRGDRIAFRARLRPPSGSVNPGGFDYAAYLQRRHIHALASVHGPGQVVRLKSGGDDVRWTILHLVDGWRERIRLAAVHSLDQPALGFYLGIISGERGFLSPDLRDRFMTTGTVHILSISGSHLGLIAFLSFFLVREGARRLPATWLLAITRRITPTRLAALATVPPVTFYAMLAGGEVATVRALMMILVFLLATWLGYVNHLLHAIAAAAVLILLHDPQALLDISFQLSFVSVLAIALVIRGRADEKGTPPRAPVGAGGETQTWADSGQPGWLHRWLREYAWITGGVTLATVPLVAYYFNQIPWLGLFANLIVVPVVGFLLVPLGLLSAVALLVIGGDTLPLGPANQLLLHLTSQLVELLARIPGAEWHVASPAVPLIVLFYLMLLVGCRPAAGPTLRCACLCVVAIILGWWMWSPRPMQDGQTVRVTFLDVGQGDASLIELPDGGTVLIDAGASYERFDMGRAVVAPYLWDRGIRSLNLVIATHPQRDHTGGLPWIISKFSIEQYWDNGITRNRIFDRRLRRTIEERGLLDRHAVAGDVLYSSGKCRLTVLNPPVESVSSVGSDAPASQSDLPAPQPKIGLAGSNLSSGTLLNNLSVVSRLDCGSHSFLFAGDIERSAMARIGREPAFLHARVLKVPHHGARSSMSAQWVRDVQPEAAVISAGRRNPYRHPAPEVVGTYERAGASVWRTDRDGAVSISAALSSPTLTVQTARAALPTPLGLGESNLTLELKNIWLIWNQWLGP